MYVPEFFFFFLNFFFFFFFFFVGLLFFQIWIFVGRVIQILALSDFILFYYYICNYSTRCVLHPYLGTVSFLQSGSGFPLASLTTHPRCIIIQAGSIYIAPAVIIFRSNLWALF